MRATALDQEAALAQGISARRVFAAVVGHRRRRRPRWPASPLAAGGRGARPELGLVALVAFPAMILGGLDSPLGAVVGGLIIGVVQS